MLNPASIFKDYAIEASDGRIGHVSDFLFDDRRWHLRWLVVDTGSWLTARRVLIHPSAITAVNPTTETLSVRLSRRQVAESPPIDQDAPISQQMEERLYGYYGWDPAWGGSPFGMNANAMASPLSSPPLYPGMPADDRARETADPHLRSLATVKGYDILASDAAIGHLADCLIDDVAWRIRYLVVDTRNWWPGAHVLVSPHAVTGIDWAEHRVQLDITRAQVRSSPPREEAAHLDAAYVERLHGHYDWPRPGA